MARTYCYRLAHNQTLAAAGVAEVRIPNNSTLIGFHAFQHGNGGAAAGFYRSELAHNNNAVTNAGVNDPPRNQTLGSWGISYPNGYQVTVDTGYIPLNVPLIAGDRLTINQTSTGAAASTLQCNCDLYVQEK